MIVVDASAVLEALLRTPAASAVERRLFESSQTLHAPHLLDVEVAQVVRRYAANGEIDAERGRMALADLADFPLPRYPHHFLLQRIWDLRKQFHRLRCYLRRPGRSARRAAAHPRQTPCRFARPSCVY